MSRYDCTYTPYTPAIRRPLTIKGIPKAKLIDESNVQNVALAALACSHSPTLNYLILNYNKTINVAL